MNSPFRKRRDNQVIVEHGSCFNDEVVLSDLDAYPPGPPPLGAKDILEIAYAWRLSTGSCQALEQELERAEHPWETLISMSTKPVWYLGMRIDTPHVYTVWPVKPRSFSWLMLRAAVSFRTTLDHLPRRGGQPLTHERRKYNQLISILETFLHEFSGWDYEAIDQLIRRHLDRKLARYRNKYSHLSLGMSPRGTLSPRESKWFKASEKITEDFFELEQRARRLQRRLQSLVSELPPPPTNRPSDSQPLRDTVKRLRAIYKYTVGKEPGRGKSPFARGVYHFVHAVAPEYNTSLEAIAKLITRTLT